MSDRQQDSAGYDDPTSDQWCEKRKADMEGRLTIARPAMIVAKTTVTLMQFDPALACCSDARERQNMVNEWLT